MQNVLLLYPQAGKTGNHSTILRLREHFMSFGHLVISANLAEGCQLLKDADSATFDIVVTIHAYKSAPLLQDLRSSVRLVVIFGGTDLNENASCKDQCLVMKKMVERSSCCVAFSSTMRELACILWPEYESKIHVIHQGVSTSPRLQFNLRSYLQSRFRYECREYILLLVAGIRPVKDPLYLVQHFADSSLSKTTSFVIIGGMIDEAYSKTFTETVCKLRESNVLYAGELARDDAHAAIQQSLCLVNSSCSEGMSGAILEAFDLGVAVLARCIAGNSYLVDHGKTGLLYSTPQEFLKQLERLIDSPNLRQKLITAAKTKVEDNFSIANEKKLYVELLADL